VIETWIFPEISTFYARKFPRIQHFITQVNLPTYFADELHLPVAVVVIEDEFRAVPGDEVNVDAVLDSASVVGFETVPRQVASELLASQTAPPEVTLAAEICAAGPVLLVNVQVV